MFTIKIIRFSFVVIIGILSYFGLLYSLGLYEGKHIKKRKKTVVKERKVQKPRIIAVYILTLCIGMLLVYILIQYRIRGVA